ncbi:MAG: aminotransferase class I/II-fold pyridoxal phosphate-dependent enzyme [Myxococcaceae bacterium]|nr:aminotransferase class I/II-fold pyridoxal phosphate-dependent enzyme [Myxococcaceae bacterium]
MVGMACRFPHADDLNGLWQVVKEGDVTFSAPPADRWTHRSFFSSDARATDKTYVQKGAFLSNVRDFAALHYGLAPRRVQVMDPQQRLMVEVVREALQDAGYEKKPLDKANTGVFVGASVSEYKDLLTSRMRAQQIIDGNFGDALNEAEAQALRAAMADVVPTRAFSIAGGLLNMIAASVSQTFDLSGPSFTLDAACSSALVAIHEGVVHLRAGQCNVALAGGVYLNLTPDNLVGFSRIGAISPTGACRPFDARADGFIMGEGAGVVVLKRLEDALADKDRVYAVIKGSGCNNDGRGDGPMTPRPEGQIDAMARAHREADFPVQTLGLVETHGTATTVGDVVEVGALKSFFNQRAGKQLSEPYCYLSSIKANVGHTMSAAGVAGFIKTALALYHRAIPPQPGVEELNPKLDLARSPFRIAHQLTHWEKPAQHNRRAAVSSFGFGGTNAHVLLEEAPESSPVDSTEREELFVFSAATPALLSKYLLSSAQWLAESKATAADVAYTLSQRALFACRVAFVAKGETELSEKLTLLSKAIATGAELPAGVWYAAQAAEVAAHKVAFLFPGQGAQRVGLLKDWVARFPSFQRTLEKLDGAAKNATGISVFEALYPHSGHDAVAAQRHLTQTHVCQPAMAALGLATADFLKQLGVEADAVLGHSLGEFAAASHGGMLPGPEAVALVARRGALMQNLKLADPGAMCAVMASHDMVAPLIEGLENVVIANINHPTQVVLSGTTAAVKAAAEKLNARGLKVTPLDVSHAFHSPLMNDVDKGMAQLLAATDVKPANLPVVSCITGAPYASADQARRVWEHHAAAPVQFVRALSCCVTMGIDTFVQMGAGTALLSFARGVAAQTPDSAFVALAQNDESDGASALLSALGQLFVRGRSVSLGALHAGNHRTLVGLPPTPLETQSYWGVERNPARPPRKMSTNSKGAPMDALVALFREQMSLLNNQAEILKAQAQALTALAGGDGAALQAFAQASATVASVPVVAAPVSAVAKTPDLSNWVAAKAPAAAVETAPAPHGVNRDEVHAKVTSFVSRISAFPTTALKAEQTLTGELGFDSLMLVELDADIGKAWPALGGLPRELFTRTTTIATLVNHITTTLSNKPAHEPAAAPVASAPVQRYLPVITQTPRHTVRESVVSFTHPLLVTQDPGSLATEVVRVLKERGVNAVIGNAETQGGFSGVIHLGSLKSTNDYKAPVRELLKLAQRFTPETAEAFVTVTGLGGHFGLQELKPEAFCTVGALGFTKALAHEWPDARVKAIDVDTRIAASALAAHIVDELLSTDATSEVGFTQEGRVQVELVPTALNTAKQTAFGADDVVLITGGAKGLGAKFATALAQNFKVTLALTGRSAATEETGKVIASLKQAGAKACSYHVMDVRDAASVERAVAEIRKAHGKIDGVVHAAGVLADGWVGSKEASAVDGVLDTKVGGALNLLKATQGDALKRVVYVGSWAGRFGNAAQTDYSAANEMMARLVRWSRPPVQSVAIDFPPWETSSMVKRIPSFKKAEMLKEGVTFLSDDEGTRAFIAELMWGNGEVVLGRELPTRVKTHKATFPVSRLNHVYLNDHQMAGQRVLPLAAAVDHLASAGMEAAGKTDSAFTLKNFTLQRPVMVPDTTWLETVAKQRGADSAIELKLMQGNAVSYEGALDVLSAAPSLASPVTLKASGSLPMPLTEFYQGFTFHGPRLQGIIAIEAVDEQGISGVVKTSQPADWIKEPLRKQWTIDPLVLDASFQLAGYWAWVKHQRAGFPLGFAEYTQVKPFGAGPVKCTVTFEAAQGDIFTGTLTWTSASGEVLAVMKGTQAEFKKRDPQFQKTAAEAVATNAETPAVATPTANIDESTYNFEKFPEYEELTERLQLAEAFGLKNPYFSVHERICNDTTVVNGKEMINFSSYNYVGNSGDPVVSAAAKAAIDQYGTSVSASRVASGEKPLTGELERGLARFFGTESSLVFVSGHATNVTVIGHVVGPGDLILHDALAHDSIIGGAKLSGAKRRPFPHNDFEALDRALEQLRGHYRRVLICIEGTYSMDGDIPDLPKFIAIKKKHKALLLVDEAHSAGVVGKTGRGIGEYYDVNRADVDMWMGTLSKSFASCGGYICGTQALTEYLKYTTPGFVYSVGISPPNAASALAALQQLEAHPERVTAAQNNAKYFLGLLRAKKIDTGMSKDSAVVPAIIGNSVLCLQVSDRLKERGINVQPILYPAVEEHAARLRFFVSATHTPAQLETTATILAEELERLTREQTDAVA